MWTSINDLKFIFDKKTNIKVFEYKRDKENLVNPESLFMGELGDVMYSSALGKAQILKASISDNSLIIYIKVEQKENK